MLHQPQLLALRERLTLTIVGQHELLDRLLIGLLTGGHLLVEGLPGLAKTTAVKALAEGLHASFQRIQFTPDLLPADLTGSEVFYPETREFRFRPGPVFHELVLADEINRAPAKVQSALLEAMQESQVTVAGVSHPLPRLFMVMATQNPLEQAGTYPLPEAQLDRFLLHVLLDYPNAEEELTILRRQRARWRGERPEATEAGSLSPETVLAARAEVAAVHIDPSIEAYIVRLVQDSRNLAGVLVGAGPRATLALAQSTQAHAYLQGREFVLPEDVRALAPDVLRHRLVLTPAAEVSGQTAAGVIQQLLDQAPTP